MRHGRGKEFLGFRGDSGFTFKATTLICAQGFAAFVVVSAVSAFTPVFSNFVRAELTGEGSHDGLWTDVFELGRNRLDEHEGGASGARFELVIQWIFGFAGFTEICGDGEADAGP